MKGKKTCPSCNTINGARTLVCKGCSYLFLIKVKIKADSKDKVKKEDEPKPIVSSFRIRRIITPSGEPPFKLKGTDAESVLAWKEKINDWFMENEKATILDDGLVYWIDKYFYPMRIDGCINPEYSSATSHLMPVYKDKPIFCKPASESE